MKISEGDIGVWSKMLRSGLLANPIYIARRVHGSIFTINIGETIVERTKNNKIKYHSEWRFDISGDEWVFNSNQKLSIDSDADTDSIDLYLSGLAGSKVTDFTIFKDGRMMLQLDNNIELIVDPANDEPDTSVWMLGPWMNWIISYSHDNGLNIELIDDSEIIQFVDAHRFPE